MKYIEVKSVSQNDCTECIFSLKCINPCRLPSGYHYEENKKWKLAERALFAIGTANIAQLKIVTLEGLTW